MLELSVVVLVYDRLGGAGVGRLAEPALCEFLESNVKAGAKGVCNPKLSHLSVRIGIRRESGTYHEK